MIDIDDRLTEIYDYIATYKGMHGYSPSQDDIAEAMGLTKREVAQAMDTMETRGMIVQPRGLLRVIKLLPRQPNGNGYTAS
jgi:DNA-binding MarR family transcriptional regulator